METTLNKHYLYPASLFASKRLTLVTTILGTCVAVCLYDPINKVGGINHYMLPRWEGKGLPSAKWGDYANRTLLERMLVLGAEKKHIQAKLFGGLCRNSATDLFGIGVRNIFAAESWIQHHKIPVMAKNTGGISPRRLVFNTEAGTVDMHLLLPEIVQEKKGKLPGLN